MSKVHQPNVVTHYQAILAIGTITWDDFRKAFPDLPSVTEPELRKGNYIYPRTQSVQTDLIHLEGAAWEPGEVQVPHYAGDPAEAHRYVDPYDGRVAQAAYKRNVCLKDTKVTGITVVFNKGEWHFGADDALVRTLMAEASWGDLFSTYECISTKREQLRMNRQVGWQDYLTCQADLDKAQKGS